jgi:hypothetical protein
MQHGILTTLEATSAWPAVEAASPAGTIITETTVGRLAAHKGVTVAFDLHIVGPWQTESFSIALGGVTRTASFSNVSSAIQSFPDLLGGSYPAQTASVAADVFSNGVARAVYHFRHRFDHTDTTQPLVVTLTGGTTAWHTFYIANFSLEVDQGAKEWTAGTAVSSCADIVNGGFAHGDGVYTVEWQDLSGAVDLPVFCDTASDGGGWTMVYKKSTGVALSPIDAWGTAPRNERHTELLGRNKATLDYASSLITHAWSKFTTARVEINVGGVPVKTLRYDLTGADYLSWFAPAHYVSGGWSDIPRAINWQGSGDGRYYSFAGTNLRTFYINNNWGGCPNDRGWMVVTSSLGCSWEVANTVLYSVLDTMASEINTAQFKAADDLVVMVR